VMRALLDAAAPMEPRSGSVRGPLCLAVRNGRWELIDLLLARGASVAGMELLAEMRFHHIKEPAKVLRAVKMLGQRDESVLVEEAERDEEGAMQPIHRFCRHPLADASCQERLIDYIVDTLGEDVVNALDSSGRRPLQHALPLKGPRQGPRHRASAVEGARSATPERLYRYGAATQCCRRRQT